MQRGLYNILMKRNAGPGPIVSDCDARPSGSSRLFRSMSEVITRESDEVVSSRRGACPKCLMSQEGRTNAARRMRSRTPMSVFSLFAAQEISFPSPNFFPRLLGSRMRIAPALLITIGINYTEMRISSRDRGIKDREKRACPRRICRSHFPPSSRHGSLERRARRNPADSIKRAITRQT